MHVKSKLWIAVIAAVMLMTTMPASATTLLQMQLGDLVQRADTIFRGTVIDVEQSSIEVGGGELPMVIYRLRVDELVKGQPDVVKGDDAYIEIRMVGSIKDSVAAGNAERFSIFRDVPRLAMGSDYVLFMTPESPVGLSVTVGLGQGAFSVYSADKTEYAVNGFDNAGLGLGDGGAVAYADLMAAVKGLMGQ
jgi:hypothetical protein